MPRCVLQIIFVHVFFHQEVIIDTLFCIFVELYGGKVGHLQPSIYLSRLDELALLTSFCCLT